MSAWIFISVAAALFQTLRFMLQKVLASETLSPAGATFSRFAYSAPVICALLAGYLWATDMAMPPLTLAFWGFALVGGVSQILATICVVALFRARNFAVGITFKKTEVLQTALVGLVVLGDQISALGWGAILLGLCAVLVLSAPPKGESTAPGLRAFANRATGLGLASGVLFAFSAVSYRAASLELGAVAPVLRAGVTLCMVVLLQVAVMLAWLWLRDRAEIGRVWAARRVAVWVGLTSMGGSFCWFWAFTLQNAAYVKAVGQVELLLSLLASVLFFNEKVTARELWGMGLLMLSILAVLLSV